MKNKAQEILAQEHTLGRQAQNLLEATGALHFERENQLLDAMIVWFNNQPWDERVAIRYIAALAENREQRVTLEHRARKGAEARAKLFGNTTTTAE